MIVCSDHHSPAPKVGELVAVEQPDREAAGVATATVATAIHCPARRAVEGVLITRAWWPAERRRGSFAPGEVSSHPRPRKVCGSVPVRLLGRLLLVLVLDALALLALSWLLPGFTLAGPGAAFGLALALGVANSVVWPFLIRFALPFTVLTLGLGALVLNAALLLGAAWLLDDVQVDGLFEAVVVTLGLTLLTTMVGGVLALDRGDLWYRHIIRRQAKRSQLAEKTDVPGVVFLEIDGLAYDVLRRAMRDGNAPGLARWVHDRGYRIEPWETDWSSQTGACQAGLLHGNDHDMPAFRWWEKDTGRAIVTNHPKDAAELERRQSNGRGLLYADGASRANILSGDAPHSMLTMSTVLDRDRPGRLGQDYFAYFASPYGVARTVLRVIGEVFVERFAAVQQVRRDVRPRIKRDWKYALVRAYATVIQLDLQVAAVTADVLAGRPVVYTTFLAYDEVAHHSGLERPDTLAVLRRVDLAIERIAAAAEHGPRPVPARRALRPRPEPGRDVPPALRRGSGGRRRASRRRRGPRRGRALRRRARLLQRERRGGRLA